MATKKKAVKAAPKKPAPKAVVKPVKNTAPAPKKAAPAAKKPVKVAVAKSAVKSKPVAKAPAKKIAKPAPKPTTNTNTPSAPTTFPDYFPLKKGSQGERVKQLQQALINKYGSSVLPKGVTGIYDTDLQNALVK